VPLSALSKAIQGLLEDVACHCFWKIFFRCMELWLSALHSFKVRTRCRLRVRGSTAPRRDIYTCGSIERISRRAQGRRGLALALALACMSELLQSWLFRTLLLNSRDVLETTDPLRPMTVCRPALLAQRPGNSVRLVIALRAMIITDEDRVTSMGMIFTAPCKDRLHSDSHSDCRPPFSSIALQSGLCLSSALISAR
jgi:hypothetical protein